MTRYQELKAARYVHDHPPEGWRNVWAPRQKIFLSATKASALKHMSKKQHLYPHQLQVDIHPKDGYVVYYEKEASS